MGMVLQLRDSSRFDVEVWLEFRGTLWTFGRLGMRRSRLFRGLS